MGTGRRGSGYRRVADQAEVGEVKIQFKPDVFLTGVDEGLWKGILLFAGIRARYTNLPLVVTALENGIHRGTSGYDPTKSPPSNSFHYRQESRPPKASDLRSHDLDNADKIRITEEAKVELGPDYHLVLEAQNTANEHYHLQYGHFA